MEVDQADHRIECNSIREFEGHHQWLFIHECNVYKYVISLNPVNKLLLL